MQSLQSAWDIKNEFIDHKSLNANGRAKKFSLSKRRKLILSIILIVNIISEKMKGMICTGTTIRKLVGIETCTTKLEVAVERLKTMI